MIAVSNIISIFAVPSEYTEWDTASVLRAGFLYPFLNRYWYSTPSWKLNGSTAPCEWKAEGKAVPLLLDSQSNKFICNAFHRINLFASEEQYLTSNALCSDMHRILAQPLQQRKSAIRSTIHHRHRHCLPRSHKNPVQKERRILCDADKKEPKNLFCQGLYTTERSPQFPFIIQLFIVSVVLKLVYSAAGHSSAAKNHL